MNARAIARRRMLAQQIVASRGLTPAQVVASMGAMQAQDHASALWAIGLRAPGSTRVDVEAAVAARAIVRTWPMRGTLHVVAAADVRWMLALLAPRAIAASALRSKQLELTDAHFAKARVVLSEALRGGVPRTREEVMATLDGAAISTAGQRGYHILWRLAQEGLVCFGPHQEKAPTFTLLNDWVAPAEALARDDALATLARRYVTGHGPATDRDLAWWAGITLTDARRALESVAKGLTRERIEGVEYWSAEVTEPGVETPSVHLLPGFDEHLLGYADRSAVLDAAYAPKIVPGNNGIFQPTVVLDGRVVGTWKLARKKATTLTATLFEALTKKQQRALDDAAQRYGAFLGLAPVTVALG